MTPAVFGLLGLVAEGLLLAGLLYSDHRRNAPPSLLMVRLVEIRRSFADAVTTGFAAVTMADLTASPPAPPTEPAGRERAEVDRIRDHYRAIYFADLEANRADRANSTEAPHYARVAAATESATS